MTSDEKREYYKKWKKEHPDYHKKWKMEHQESVKEYMKKDCIRKNEKQADTLIHAFNKYSRWTIEETEILKESYLNNVPYTKIARMLNRTLYSIKSRVTVLKRTGEL